MRKKVFVWNIPDMQGKIIEEVRFFRDEIQEKVEKLARDCGNS